MIRTACTVLVGALLSIVATGCWDVKTIQDTNYITAIGYDYADGQFVVYAQMLDFANVSKQEGGKTGQPASVWSGREKGGTIVEAMNRLLETSQQRVFWGQVSSVVFTDKALEHGFENYMDGLIRFREMRYTQWVYGTKEPIDRIFTVLPFFNQSPLGSILHQPEDNYRQRSYIRPLRLYKAVADYREPGSSLFLPSLGIANDVWKEGDKNDPKLEVDGLFIVNKRKPSVWAADRDLTGLRWLDRDTQRSNVMLLVEGEPAASVSIDRPKASVTPVVENGRPSYTIRITGQLVVTELLKPMSESEIEQTAEKQIASEVRRTFDYGVQRGIDLFELDHVLYRKKFDAWGKLTDDGERPLTDYALKSVRVELNMAHAGMYKVKGKVNEY
ncbi:Ger(x)C family spore germination protein [Paenibacillus sp. GYB003]|uniref:Ger(x)C family spore germination protein n=1 Tax=Paenibacillus sp. GYB003 TaxID=2994392 RepID=UPI002F9616D7